MRRLWLIIIAIISAVSASAQETADDYMFYKLEQPPIEEFSISTDTLLFYRSVQHRRDMYGDMADYRFSFVGNARRGYYFTERGLSLDGVQVRHSHHTLLRRLGLSHYSYSGLTHGVMNVGGVAGQDVYTTTEGVPINGGNAAVYFSGKGYLGGVRASLHSLMNRGWSMSIHLAAKGGDDLYVRGIYDNSLDIGLRLTKEYESGASLSFVALSRAGDKGLRRGSTQEAFSLVGDNLYNPTWGWSGDKVRNSRSRSSVEPVAIMSFVKPMGDATTMRVSVVGEYSLRANSALGWYDAMTPYPDNYRYMPSYYTDEAVADAVAQYWRMGDAAVTQIDWTDMYAQNRRSSRGAVYALEQRVERLARGEALVRFSTDVADNLTIDYGVRGEMSSSRQYKRMADLLGAQYLLDIDYYLIDDDTYSNNLQNDLRHPNREIKAGDRFSYDYALVETSLMADVGVRYHADRWRIDLSAALGGSSVCREGYFEKEIFPGAESYGKSTEKRFSPYTLKASAGYVFSSAHYLDAAVALISAAPAAESMYLNPTYNNRLVDDVKHVRTMAAELNYKFHSARFDAQASAYLHRADNLRDMMRLYDDLSATYCDVAVENISMLRYGLELAAKVGLTENLYGELTCTIGNYTYSNNPVVTHYSDTDNAVVCAKSESYMDGCRIGGAPQGSASAFLTYFASRGWVASCGVNYAGLRYVEPSFVRRTERVLRQGSVSQEIYAQFLSQQRLDDAMTVDASVSRWFRVGQSRLSLTLSVRNLLNNCDIVYSGYESSRIRHYRSGANTIYAPQDDIITYAYPRTFYCVVSWKF